ncbi:MAG: 2'-5' RNA ligase family protein [Cyanobacteria bacterium REEB67]|nr:2'-5' RNA ligase family protein [Cyanobacteria bacterium REEB67]
MVRLFVGSFLGDQEAARLGHFAEAWLPGLKKQLPAGHNARFIAPAKLHMTWLFLGEVEEDHVEAVKSWLATAVQKLQETAGSHFREENSGELESAKLDEGRLDIEVSYDNLEGWPGKDKARVIVATPSAVPPLFAKLGNELRQEFEAWIKDAGPGGGAGLFNFDKNEPRYVEFRPHLTIMRLNPAIDLSSSAVLSLLQQLLPVQHHIEEMHLVRSQNDGGGKKAGGNSRNSASSDKKSGGHINGRRQDYEIIASPW